LLDIIKRLYPK